VRQRGPPWLIEVSREVEQTLEESADLIGGPQAIHSKRARLGVIRRARLCHTLTTVAPPS
jgi:hypothetical protein